jgi:hypothetical protein
MQDILESGGLVVVAAPPLIIIAICLLFGIKRCAQKSEKCQKRLEKIKNKIFWNAIIRSNLIGYLPLAISSNIGRQLRVSSEAGNPNFPVILLLTSLIAISLQFAYFTDPIELSNPINKEKFGSFYDTVKVHRPLSMIFNSLFMLRRLLFVYFM